MTTTYRIHPAIGIARLGNSKTGWFVGPERPGQKPQDSYKDGEASVLRQGARFRIYEYRGDTPVREISRADAEITWRVHMVNRKAAGPRIFSTGNRNPGIPPEHLIIDPGERSILAGDPGPLALVGKFLGSDVPLGELRTERGGQLIVLGGSGRSFSPGPRPAPITNTFNNDRWCDDTADGRVSASIRFRDREPVEAEAAWVITAPPDFAPPIGNVISLYDIVYQAALSRFGFHHDPLLAADRVSFDQHVFPLLQRAAHTWWVDETAWGHAPGLGGDFLNEDLLKLLRDNNPNPESPAWKARNKVLARLRKPDGTGGNMPPLQPEYDSGRHPALPPWKYGVMERWAAGKFDPEAAIRPEECDPSPFDLDKAALDACVGASFYPGIEAPRILRDRLEVYGAPFRISSRVLPGLITQGLAIPWQSDFLACGSGWWPAVRPNDVFRNGEQELWAEGITSYGEMVQKWARLGFVLPSGVAHPPFIEKERDPLLAFDLGALLASAASPEIEGGVP